MTEKLSEERLAELQGYRKRIAELEAEVAELTEALTATHRNGERDLQKMESAWGKLADIREVLDRQPQCDKYDDDGPVSCGWKIDIGRIRGIMDGEADDE